MRKEVKLTRGIETLFGTLDENLQLLEKALRLKAHLKNDSLELEGEAPDIERMEQIVDDYGQLVKDGVSFGNGDLRAYLKVVVEDPASSLRTLVTTGRQHNFGRKSVVAKSQNQRAYMDMIDKHDMVFGVGPAGTGKTYLAVAMGISYLLNRRVHRIVLARPAVEAGERLGFLPGTLQEKVDPYLRPLYDALYDLLEPEKVERFLERGTIEIAPIAFMRGRTLNDSFVILDEALERLDDAAGALEGGGGEAGFDDLVLADVVYNELVLALDVGEQFAELGLHERLHRLLHGRGRAGVRIERLDDSAAYVFQTEAAARGADLCFVFGTGSKLHAGDARGDR